jgi:hypothetical protein
MAKTRTPKTPAERAYAAAHRADGQHEGNAYLTVRRAATEAGKAAHAAREAGETHAADMAKAGEEHALRVLSAIVLRRH